MLMLPLVANSDTTGNLLNQNFDSNAWSGTATGRHGSHEIAANHGQYLESTVTLSNTLTEDQIKYGWTSTLGADIWHWNNATSETEMLQTITASDGTVTTQSRKVTISGCGYTNCGSHQTYTDSYIQGMNGNTDYDITVRFNFSESTQAPYHWAVDLENPTLVIEYEPNPVFLSSTQTEELKEIEQEIVPIEFEPIETIVEYIEEVFEVVEVEEEIYEEESFIEETIVLSETMETPRQPEEERPEEDEIVAEVEVETTDISIEDVSVKVAEKVSNVSDQLKLTQLIVAKAMQNNSKISAYTSVNQDLFKQPELTTINIDAYINKTYVDTRNIYPNQIFEDRLWTLRR